MLIERGFKSGDVISMKLVNGDEIITRYESEDANTITVSKPLALTMGPQGLGMIPWMFLSARDEFTINKSQIFTYAPSKKDAADQYMQGTTGIALA
jgi:hypothetical protein